MNEFATRRRLLAIGFALPWIAIWRAVEAAQPAPACTVRKPTRSEIAGPYFKPGSPERQSLLEAGMKGRRLILTGSVTTTTCQPIPRALLDFWHANASGQYDNTGFRLRGHQFTDADGHYKLETIVPGIYPGRTEHIHVKLKVPGGPTLTTQLYFPGEPRNARDPFFHLELMVSVVRDADPLVATFDFVAST
jgi:protocatechuate 3,4-dioxygenase beta subunit